MTRPRSAAAATTLLVGAAAALCVTPVAAGEAGTGCGGVTIVVDPNEVGGPERVACVPDGGTAAGLFEQAGFALEYQPGLQDFVCRVDGTPTDRPCARGDSYWSLWWAAPAGEWAYATLGVRSLDVPDGGMLGFAWHEGHDDASPPDVTAGDASAARADRTEVEQAGDDGADFPWWAAGLAVVVLGAAAAVPVVRRRPR